MKTMTLEPRATNAESSEPRLLRILFIIDSLNLGGAELCLLRLTRSLPRERYQCRVLTFQSSEASQALREQFDCPVDCWRMDTILGPVALETAIRLRRLVKDEQIDIVHTFFQTSDLWAGPIAKLAGAKVLISSRRDMGFLRKPQHQIGYRLLRKVFDQIQTVSEGVRQWTLRADKVAPGRTRTIHNGIDIRVSAGANDVQQLRMTLALSPGTTVITTVANLRPIKGIDVLVHAAAIVAKHHPNAVFLIAGDGTAPGRRSYAIELQKLTDSLGLGKHVRFMGECKNVPALLALSDIFVLPSRSEGLSNALLEAMLFGIPCVATSVGGNPEVVVDGETGYLAPTEDTQTIADRLLTLLEKPDLRKRMGRASRERILRHFSVEEMASKVERAYDDALREKGILNPVTKPMVPSSEAASPQRNRNSLRLIARHSAWRNNAVFGELAEKLGVNAVLRNYLLRDQFLVLCYHGVISQRPKWHHTYATNVLKEEFESQLDFLASKFHLMNADELIEVVEGRQEVRPRSALITFDDGYSNNYTLAAAALKARGIPAIFNVSTSYIGANRLLWPDEVFQRAVSWPERSIPLPDGSFHRMETDREQRMATAVRIQESCKRLEDWRRSAYVETLRASDSLPANLQDEEVYKFMDWDEVRALSAQGFEIGSHTVDHCILSRIPKEELDYQMRVSKERIEQEVGRECRIIAYPNGMSRDVGTAVWDAAEAAGYRAGLMLQRGLASRKNRMAVNRINVSGGELTAMFRSRAAGLYVIGQRIAGES